MVTHSPLLQGTQQALEALACLSSLSCLSALDDAVPASTLRISPADSTVLRRATPHAAVAGFTVSKRSSTSTAPYTKHVGTWSINTSGSMKQPETQAQATWHAESSTFLAVLDKQMTSEEPSPPHYHRGMSIGRASPEILNPSLSADFYSAQPQHYGGKGLLRPSQQPDWANEGIYSDQTSAVLSSHWPHLGKPALDVDIATEHAKGVLELRRLEALVISRHVVQNSY